MKGAAPRITPDEGHVIKATAWDAMRVAFTMHAETADGEIQKGMAKNILVTMDSLLEQVGNKYSNAKTWGAIMPKKFDHETFYRCLACATATVKTDWRYYRNGLYICPKCGCAQDISITNENVGAPVSGTEMPEPEKPKPASAKKKA